MGETLDVTAQIDELVALAAQAHDAGRADEAETMLSSLRQITKGHHGVNRLLGILLATKGDFEGAKAPLQDAVRQEGRDPIAFNVLSVCAYETGEFEAALEHADRAAALWPDYPEAHNSRGTALLRQHRHDEARLAFARALELTPNDPVVLLNLANAQEQLALYAEALATIEATIRIAPQIPEAHANRGNLLQLLRRYDEAVAAYDQAIALRPHFPDARWNRGLCRLLLGDNLAGWEDHEWRWLRGLAECAPRGLPQPLWLGQEPLAGRSIFLYGEQGLGDCIQFARYVPQVAALGARVIVETYPSLVELFRTLEGVDEVIGRGAPIPATDFQCPLMSLPLALREAAPGFAGAYLRADAARLTAWAGRLGAARGLRVGLVVSGRPSRSKVRERSIPLAQALAGLPRGPEYHLLQTELREADRPALGLREDLHPWMDEIGDLADTAALVELMDVVVSIDTGVAHLAGALGRPLLMMLPNEPEWRWGLGAETTPWYGTARLFHQAIRDDWSLPLARVAEMLQAWPSAAQAA